MSGHLNVVTDVLEDLFLRDAEVGVVVLGVGAHVDHAIHVQVQVVKLRQLNKHAWSVIFIVKTCLTVSFTLDN